MLAFLVQNSFSAYARLPIFTVPLVANQRFDDDGLTELDIIVEQKVL